MTDHALAVDDLRIELVSGEPVVEDVSFRVGHGEVLGLVGESGSGKTTTALALLGYARPGVRIANGTIDVAGTRISGLSEAQVRRYRGRLISYVPQDPAAALNPSVRVGDQVGNMLERSSEKEAHVDDAFELVQLPTARDFRRRFPHQLSGGQQQRVAIAAALVCKPAVVLMDEPTTGLDVVTQANLLAQVRRLQRELGFAIVYVSHDLAVVASIADRIVVMYAGRVVEDGPAARVLSEPQHPYSLGLIASVPDPREPRVLRSIPGVAVGVGERPPGCPFAPRCPQRIAACEESVPRLERTGGDRLVRSLEWRRTPTLAPEWRAPSGALPSRPASLLAVEELRAEHRGRGDAVVACSGVSFAIAQGECVALVGESGSGKTTIARCVAGLHAPARGRVLLDGAALAPLAAGRTPDARRRIQIVFQNPYDSLNPRHRVAQSIARPAQALRGYSRKAAEHAVADLLERVRLPARLATRFPGELSGGERQRVAVARALAADPDLIVCDEITSALDVSVQAAVLELLADLRAELGLALLLITHDLGVVSSVADRVLVLDQGVVCEQGAVRSLLASPEHAYTQRLVAAAPTLSVR